MNQFRQCSAYNVFPNLNQLLSSSFSVDYTSVINEVIKRDEFAFLYSYEMEGDELTVSFALGMAFGSGLLKEGKERKSYFNATEGIYGTYKRFTFSTGVRNLNKASLKFDTIQYWTPRDFFFTASSKHTFYDAGTNNQNYLYLKNSCAYFTSDSTYTGIILNSTLYYSFISVGLSYKKLFKGYDLFAINAGFNLQEKLELFFSTYLHNNSNYFEKYGNRYEMSLIFMLN